jgi:putative transposase
MQGQLGVRADWNAPGHAHQLTFSCFKGEQLIVWDPVRRILLAALDEVRMEFDIEVWAYVLMPEHVHMLVNPKQREYDIEAIRSSFKGKSGFRAIAWLREHEPECMGPLKVGTQGKCRFWQEGKGHDRNLWTPPAIWNSIEYIHGNPVRRGLCQTPADWPWSSCRWYAGLEPVEFVPDRCPVDPPDPGSGVWRVWFKPE